ncbi:MAG TPA: hypothetical protein VFG23_27730, partial [Polyangia bacterium]|nr:hypothetical protein [Polyangia bacterium]
LSAAVAPPFPVAPPDPAPPPVLPPLEPQAARPPIKRPASQKTGRDEADHPCDGRRSLERDRLAEEVGQLPARARGVFMEQPYIPGTGLDDQGPVGAARHGPRPQRDGTGSGLQRGVQFPVSEQCVSGGQVVDAH